MTDKITPSTTNISQASAPFDKASADVILRSADNVDFRVHKIVLALASPFFEDMFGLPQIVNGADIPLIPCTESSRTLDFLLRLCYPVDDPAFLSPGNVRDALCAAIKYQMLEATKVMKNWLSQSAITTPLVVYAVALELKLADVAAVAAEHFRRSRLDTYVEEMDRVCAGAYFRLLQHRTAVGKPIFIPFPETTSSARSSTGQTTAPSAPVPHALSAESGGDLILRSSDGVDFYVFEKTLCLASSIPLSAWPRQQNDNFSETGLRTIFLADHSRVLSYLLQVIYPITDPSIADIADIVAVVEAAITYRIGIAEDFGRRKVKEKIDTDPLRTYLIAARFNWKAEARTAAALAVYQERDVYVPEMEFVSARAYRQFLTYREQCRQIVDDHISTLVGKPKPAPVTLSFFTPVADPPFYWSEKGHSEEWWYKIFAAIRPTIHSQVEPQNCLHSHLSSIPRWWPAQPTAASSELQTFLNQSDQLETAIRSAVEKIKSKR